MLRIVQLSLVAAVLVSLPCQAQVIRVAEATSDDIRNLDRSRTVVLLPGGILEQHGPYLPTFSDGFWNERLANAVADAIVARPGWSVLLFPTVPLGASGANDVGLRFNFPGTYAVRSETLRSIFMDLGSELGEQGFRQIFIVHAHGAPIHNRVLDEAGDYFRDAYGGQMVNLAGLLPVLEAWTADKSVAHREEEGLPIHAGMDETSWMLFLEPNLVRPGYRNARPQTGSDMAELTRIAAGTDWPGYFGSPRLASAAHGARIWNAASAEAVRIALAIIDGTDPLTFTRSADAMLEDPAEQDLERATLRYEEAMRARQELWLAGRSRR